MSRFYRVIVSGYGAEVVMGSITKRQYEFFNEEKKKYYDDDSEMWNAFLDDGFSSEQFPEDIREDYEWYDKDDILHTWAPYIDHTQITVEEVENEEWNAKVLSVDPVFEIEGDKVMDEEEVGKITYGANDETYPLNLEGNPYVFMGVSAEKGTFFDGAIEIDGEFDPKKLNFEVEDIDGEYMLTGLTYGDPEDEDSLQDVDLNGDTRVKSLDYYFLTSEDND